MTSTLAYSNPINLLFLYCFLHLRFFINEVYKTALEMKIEFKSNKFSSKTDYLQSSNQHPFFFFYTIIFLKIETDYEVILLI